MKDFMSRYMRRHANDKPSAIKTYREEFLTTLAAVNAHLGYRPFHLRSGLNSSVFDAVFVAFSNNLDAIPADVSPRYEALTDDETFQSMVRAGTTDVEQVRRRVGLAEQRLFGK